MPQNELFLILKSCRKVATIAYKMKNVLDIFYFHILNVVKFG